MNPERFTVEQVCNAIRQARGIKTIAATILGCTWPTVNNYCLRYDECQQALFEARASVIDMAETQLLTKLQSGDWNAIKFVLLTIGKGRGFKYQSEQLAEQASTEDDNVSEETLDRLSTRIIEIVAEEERDSIKALPKKSGKNGKA